MRHAALLVVTALIAARPAFGQTARPVPHAASPRVAEEAAPAAITVTAQKRTENLQQVPIAITVISGAQLDALSGINIENAQYLVPALNFRKAGASINQFLFLRGIGTSSFSIAGEPSVSTVVDGVVLSRAGEAFTDLVDIERVEVLRGPQGTLFGKNASAGVVNIVTTKPGYEFRGFADGSYFNESEYRGRTAIDLPISSRVRTRLTGFYDSWNGNIDNTYLKREVNGFKRYGVRETILADLSPSVHATIIGDWRRSRDDCCAETIGSTPSNALLLTVLPKPQGDRTRQIANDLLNRNLETSWGISGQLDAELGGVILTSITAFRDYEDRNARDGDFLPAAYAGFNQLHDDGPQIGHTFSQELRLTSPGAGFFTYVIGAYYSQAYSRRMFARSDKVCRLAPGVPVQTMLVPCGSPLTTTPSFPFARADFGSTFQNTAIFGQSTAHFTDKLRGLLGLRYTLDQLDVFARRVATLAGPGIAPSFDAGVYNNGIVTTVPASPNAIAYRNRANSDNLSGKAGLEYDLAHDMMVYGSYARGYKGPAFNVFSNLTQLGAGPIAPETADSYEGGIKTAFLGRRLTLNLAGFYARYHDFQANNPDIVAGVLTMRLTNAGEVSTRGVEVEALLRPARYVTLAGAFAYTDAHVDAFKMPPGALPGAVVPSGTPLAYAPRVKASLSGEYRLRTHAFADVIVGANSSFQSSEISQVDEFAANRAATTIHPYGLLSLHASLLTHDDRYKLTFTLNNVLDQSFAAEIATGGPGGTLRYIIPREADRYCGVTFRVNFGRR